MKENIDIEKLFKDKFESFQPDVNPSAWANIQAGMGAAGTTAAATGVSAAVKIALITGGIAAASVATWYFGFYEPVAPITTPAITEQNNQLVQEDVTTGQTIIHVNDQNDPTILDNKEEIEKELRGGSSTTTGTNETATVNGVPLSQGDGSHNTTTVTTTPDPQVTIIDNDTNDDVADIDQVDKTKPAPSGRMEFTQSNVYAPSTVAFSANAKNHSEVTWDFGDGTSGEGTDVKHSYTRPGKYTVSMRVVGEEYTYAESQEIVVKTKSTIDNIPNVITPNNDRINEVFSISTTDIESFTISIRDRNGKEVFNSNDKDFTWDGTNFSGETVEKGTYNYIIIAEGTDGSVFKIPGEIHVEY